jgi:hypothetical protein
MSYMGCMGYMVEAAGALRRQSAGWGGLDELTLDFELET